MDLRDRYLGCLLGQAIGDALGAPLEFPGVPPGITTEELLRDFVPVGDYPIGQYTDDTQMAMAVAESIAEAGGVRGEVVAEHFKTLWEEEEVIGAGIACTAAVRRLLEGAAWDEAGEPEGVAGNGAAMRAAPIGLFHCDDLSRIPDAARIQSRVTHTDPQAAAGAAIVATAVGYAATRTRVQPDPLLDLLLDVARPMDPAFADRLTQLRLWLAIDEHKAVQGIVKEGQFGQHAGSWRGAITPYVVPTVLISLYYFLKHPRDFEAAVGGVILVDGDVDTTAAITGAMVGAHVGVRGLPTNLLKHLHNRDGITETADRLLEAHNVREGTGAGPEGRRSEPVPIRGPGMMRGGAGDADADEAG